MSEFYSQEQHSDETRSVCPLKGIFQVRDPSESMYRKNNVGTRFSLKYAIKASGVVFVREFYFRI